ncbi:MAG: hypothetical protein A2Y38_12065 [Spirochaetes bacterium GWB1_59_5]|nr:MAG: hypothetical protein A2Y38_12065 [Spirochaetes bacterium GWB1_59_5]
MGFFFKFASTSHASEFEAPIKVEPFLFDFESRNNPSEFEIVFFIGGTRYRYGIGVDREKVIYEYLFAILNIREVTLFTREGQTLEINPTYFKEGISRREFSRKNASFVSTCAQNNGELATRIVSAFKDIIVTSGLLDQSILTNELLQNDASKARVVDFLKFADIQLNDLKMETAIEDFSDIHDQDVKELFVRKYGFMDKKRVLFGHTVYSGGVPLEQTYIESMDESSGTRKLFEYAAPIIRTLDSGGTLFIDEFDTRLHPLMIEALIRLFNSAETNPTNAQLVVSCHAVNIMTNRIFRRDQIWFCEKDLLGATAMYSLLEFKENDKKSGVRNDASFSKNYLQGKYGAVPYLGAIYAQTKRTV